MAADPKEIMSQEEIDAYIASVQAQDGKKQESQQQASLEKKETAPQAEPESVPQEQNKSSSEPKEIMSQEEIDEYIASIREQEEKSEKEDSQPQAPPSEQKKSEAVSQDDIDALISQQQETTQEPQPDTDEQKDSGDVAQADIDAMLSQQQEATQEPQPKVVGDSEPGEFSLGQEDPEGALSQNETDTVFLQQESELAETEKDTWEELGGNILSQDEINALLSGLSEPDGSSNSIKKPGVDTGPIEDTALIARKKHFERQKKKEEEIIRKKKKATAMIRELLRIESKRISTTQKRKNRRIDQALYTRYEVTRADRTKIIVSMSERTAEEYNGTHPGCCLYKI